MDATDLRNDIFGEESEDDLKVGEFDSEDEEDDEILRQVNKYSIAHLKSSFPSRLTTTSTERRPRGVPGSTTTTNWLTRGAPRRALPVFYICLRASPKINERKRQGHQNRGRGWTTLRIG